MSARPLLAPQLAIRLVGKRDDLIVFTYKRKNRRCAVIFDGKDPYAWFEGPLLKLVFNEETNTWQRW